jgi:D-tyrosyl-tRNA(Tyr) deacylase
LKVVIQRVKRAAVRVAGQTVGRIEAGALILAGVARDDTGSDVRHLAGKVARLRIFDDAGGKMNKSIQETEGSFLVVSQFTLYGDCGKGNRPSYLEAAEAEKGRRHFDLFVDQLRHLGLFVETGRFGETMEVELVNDGPVTLILESRGRAEP